MKTFVRILVGLLRVAELEAIHQVAEEELFARDRSHAKGLPSENQRIAQRSVKVFQIIVAAFLALAFARLVSRI